MKKIKHITGAAILLALLGGGIYLNGLMPIITGYAAKNLASAVFVSGRNAEEVEALDLNFSFIRYTSNTVDNENKTVTSRFLWGKSTAAWCEGYGVTLLRGTTAEELRAKHPAQSQQTWTPLSLPAGDSAVSARLEPIARAFVDERAYNGHPFAFMVLHKGGVVSERYDKGIGPDTRLLSWSMAKSFTNAIAGIMTKDSLVDIHAPMDIPEWQGDERSSITLSDLMQMQSGLEWNEDYGARSDVNIMLHCEQDMGGYAISKPLESKPGTHWYYSSGSTNIVMRYLRDRFPSDEEFLNYLNTRFYAPLGIQDIVFEQDMSGTPVGSSYVYATAADFARFGQMYLDDGCANGERVLPEGWVKYTCTPASDSEGCYGAFFWLNRQNYANNTIAEKKGSKPDNLPDMPADLFYCNGHDGQRIYVIPSEELVVVVLSYSPKPGNVIDFNRLLRDIIRVKSEE
ncbi:MAG: serine hydrolase [Bacteroidaceae bacterium]|nr:serine hydrolase [Bacteroidaceae bacterium]